jgi:hypothetical protein
MTEEQGNNSAEDGPGPYQGVFGSSGGSPAPGPPPGPTPYGDRPGAYGGMFGADPNPYAYRPGPPKQVSIAAVISLGLGAICLLLAGFTLTSAGEQISEIVTGSKDAEGVVVAGLLISAIAYILPAIYVRKRRPWARFMLIAVAAIGIAGGVMSLPAGILGLAIHTTVFVLMVQNPTKLWFHHR